MCPILKKTSLSGLATLFFICLAAVPLKGLTQSPVLQFLANYVSSASGPTSYSANPTSPGSFSACASNNYTYTWNNGTANQLKLVGFTANSKSYVISTNAIVLVKLRRVNNPVVTGTRSILYSESTSTTAIACPTGPRQLNFRAPYNDDMASFLNNNVLNHGTDNLFTNALNNDGNNNNIERVDVIFPGGIGSAYPIDAGFILCERGNNNAHDAFRIAAILSVDGSNNPTSFGPAKNCVPGNGSNNGSWGHPTLSSGNRQLPAYILRKDESETSLRVSSHVNQELGGVFFSLSDLGVAEEQVIYGYALLGPDGIANPSSAELLDLNNDLVYPTGTTESQFGGLDLISINTFYGTNQALGHTGLTSFSGILQNGLPELNWYIQDQPPGTIVYLERSTNANTFSVIHSYNFQMNETSRSYRDHPAPGGYYYRLRFESPSGKHYSQVVYLIVKKAHIKIFPTVLEPGDDLKVETNQKDPTEVIILGMNGEYYKLGTIINGEALLKLPRYIARGIYIIQILKNGIPLGTSGKLVVQ